LHHVYFCTLTFFVDISFELNGDIHDDNMKNVIESIEEDQKHNNTRKIYQTVNQFKKGCQHKFSIIRNKKRRIGDEYKGESRNMERIF